MEIRHSATLSVKVENKEHSKANVGEAAIKNAAQNVHAASAAVAHVAAHATPRDEVEEANHESSRSEVRDVETASELAQSLKQSIPADTVRAMDAQANQLPDSVHTLLA